MAWLARVRIDRARLLTDLHALRKIGAVDYVATARGGDGVSKGVVRPALTAKDVEAREWFMGRCSDAGLAPEMDRIGTVLARSAGDGAPRLLAGSHSDTQPTGGWLDGALGVCYALEAARAVKDAGGPPAIDVVNFQDEEGRFGSLTGSSAFVGDPLNERAVSGAPEAAAPRETLGDAMAARGLADRPLFTVEADRYGGFFEAHIEQATRLESAGFVAANVKGIVGLRQLAVEFSGLQGHAGSTPMADRKDAAMAACRFVSRVDAVFGDVAPEGAVWTVGSLALAPNTPSIIPGHSKVVLQFRYEDDAGLDAMEAAATACAEETAGVCGWGVSRDRPSVRPVPMDARLREEIAVAAATHAGDRWLDLASGAVHDAANMARVMPAAMLFVPSIDGVSHAFHEDTHEDDIAAGAEIYATACARMLAGWRDGGIS